MEIPDLGTILCAIDLSEYSESALSVAAGLANHPGAKLLVLHVESAGPSGETPARLNEFILATLPGWFAYRDGTDTLLRSGPAAQTILAEARKRDARLIVMGTRGRGALGRALLGSTAADVLRESPVPVAVVPPTNAELVALEETGSRPHLGIVLVPVDLTAPSANQLSWAGKMSGGSEHRLLMLHVVPKGSDPGHATERMRALAKSVPSVRGFKLLVAEGNVADQICHMIRHDGIRFVVLGRDSSAPGKLAYRVLQDTRAAVVMVPG
jgi:nucleotide-binding universal stress UspA family protein